MPAEHDKNFDDLVHRFRKNIYNTDKGKIRMEILTRDLQESVHELNQKRLNILDIGAGQGQFALELASSGHKLTLTDISSKMLELARVSFADAGIENTVFIHSAAQELDKHIRDSEKYDLVICHAVLEWLADPESVLKSLKKYLKPGGYLSLMFYSRTGLIYQNLTLGNFDHVLKNSLAGEGTTLTPINPQDPDDVYQWLKELDLEVLCKSGVRVFYDGIHRERRKELNSETIFKLEKEFSRKEPYCLLARYIHVVCKN